MSEGQQLEALIGLQLPRKDLKLLLDLVAARAERYEITADYCARNGLYDQTDPVLAGEVSNFVASLERGYDEDDALAAVNDARQAMEHARTLRSLEERIKSALGAESA